MQRPYEVTDEQRKKLEPRLPGKVSDPGRTARDSRQFVIAVLFVLKTGIPWPDLPERFGKSNTVWKRFDRWCARGVRESIFRELGEGELIDEFVEVHLDSSVIKSHQTASTGHRQPG
jgi:putative transposase